MTNTRGKTSAMQKQSRNKLLKPIKEGHTYKYHGIGENITHVGLIKNPELQRNSITELKEFRAITIQ